jgi:cation diffusion facilitator CzcD-associated flavoprotein CzcO
MRSLLLSQVRRALGGALDMRHFTPGYQPWDQRLCVVPDGDLFAAIRGGNATVVTDQIAGFDAGQVKLASGQTLDADIVVTATGLDLQTLGGARVFVDGQAYAPGEHMLYKGVLLENLPNFAWIVGYTNASWTLKADLASQYLCRLYKHMDASGLGVAVARDRRGCKLADETVFGGLSAGYVQRGNQRLPRQGREAPWRVTHHYPSDKQQLLHAPIADGVLSFAPLQTAVAPSAAEARTPCLQAA